MYFVLKSHFNCLWHSWSNFIFCTWIHVLKVYCEVNKKEIHHKITRKRMPYDLTCALISIIAFTVNMNGKFAQNFCSSAAYSIVSRILFFFFFWICHSHSKIIEIEKDNTTMNRMCLCIICYTNTNACKINGNTMLHFRLHVKFTMQEANEI